MRTNEQGNGGSAPADGLIVCLNCGEQFEGNYCPECGQTADTGRYNMSAITRRVLDAVNIEHGLLFLMLEMTRRPGRLIRAYLSGHRAPVYGPLKYLLLSTAIVAFLCMLLDIESANTILYKDGDIVRSLDPLYNEHVSMLYLLVLPLYALVTRWLFRKWGYNYAEHLVINTFIQAQISVFKIALIGLLFWQPLALNVAAALVTMLYPVVVFLGLSPRRTFGSVMRCTFTAGVSLTLHIFTIAIVVVVDIVVLGDALGLTIGG
ncbi:MAG: DUF3667 domain-containing protein [Candidatus Cloacimonetes bacterium]|nr:DUF3667 domain-containing protein [Candidatus Cloacimonadota bacterium]